MSLDFSENAAYSSNFNCENDELEGNSETNFCAEISVDEALTALTTSPRKLSFCQRQYQEQPRKSERPKKSPASTDFFVEKRRKGGRPKKGLTPSLIAPHSPIQRAWIKRKKRETHSLFKKKKRTQRESDETQPLKRKRGRPRRNARNINFTPSTLPPPRPFTPPIKCELELEEEKAVQPALLLSEIKAEFQAKQIISNIEDSAEGDTTASVEVQQNVGKLPAPEPESLISGIQVEVIEPFFVSLGPESLLNLRSTPKKKACNASNFESIFAPVNSDLSAWQTAPQVTAAQSSGCASDLSFCGISPEKLSQSSASKSPSLGLPLVASSQLISLAAQSSTENGAKDSGGELIGTSAEKILSNFVPRVSEYCSKYTKRFPSIVAALSNFSIPLNGTAVGEQDQGSSSGSNPEPENSSSHGLPKWVRSPIKTKFLPSENVRSTDRGHSLTGTPDTGHVSNSNRFADSEEPVLARHMPSFRQFSSNQEAVLTHTAAASNQMPANFVGQHSPMGPVPLRYPFLRFPFMQTPPNQQPQPTTSANHAPPKILAMPRALIGCFVKFPNTSQDFRHALVCRLCGFPKGSVEELEAHIAHDHWEWTPYQCCYCSAVRRPTLYTLQLHLKEVHPDMEHKVVYKMDELKAAALKQEIETAVFQWTRYKNQVEQLLQPGSSSDSTSSEIPVIARTGLQTNQTPEVLETIGSKQKPVPVSSVRALPTYWRIPDVHHGLIIRERKGKIDSCKRAHITCKLCRQNIVLHTRKSEGKGVRHWKIREHVTLHFDRDVWKCQLCNYSARNKQQVYLHRRALHGEISQEKKPPELIISAEEFLQQYENVAHKCFPGSDTSAFASHPASKISRNVDKVENSADAGIPQCSGTLNEDPEIMVIDEIKSVDTLQKNVAEKEKALRCEAKKLADKEESTQKSSEMSGSFTCNLCRKNFTPRGQQKTPRWYQMRNHIASHFEQPIWKCQFCDYRSNNKLTVCSHREKHKVHGLRQSTYPDLLISKKKYIGLYYEVGAKCFSNFDSNFASFVPLTML